MPLYDCMLLLKPGVSKEAIMDLLARVGKHVCKRNGVLTDMKSFGTVQLGYGIKKLDGRYYQTFNEKKARFGNCIYTQLAYVRPALHFFTWSCEITMADSDNIKDSLSLIDYVMVKISTICMQLLKFRGQLMQMTLMTPPSFNTELYYLNKEDRLLRWLLVKHRDMKFGMDYVGEVDDTGELRNFRSKLFDDKSEEEDDDDDEYEVDEQSESREGYDVAKA